MPNGKYGFVQVKKWKAILGQTLYTKFFQPNESQSQSQHLGSQMQLPQRPIHHDRAPQTQVAHVSSTEPSLAVTKPAGQKQSRQFVLNSMGIATLLGNPEFKNSITIGKVLRIIDCLMAGETSSAAIAKQFNVELTVVELI